LRPYKSVMMKSITISILVFILSTQTFAQVKKKPVSTAPAPPVRLMKSADDSVSYAIGLSVANFFKQQNVKNPNTSLVSKAIQDALKNTNPLLNDQQANAVVMACMNKAQEERNKVNALAAESNKKIGAAWLEENKAKPGVVALPSGLQYQILKEGNGPRPTINDKVKCHYHGTLLDGTVFDSSIQRGEPIVFAVNGVIRGWTEALQLMPVGSKWKLFVPSDLAYGDQQASPTIKPGATLIFEVELLEIVK
jgi:FKBP-type peptidyl-prolyl cis-trans isomerase FklB